MSYQESVTPLQIKLHRSRLLTGFILLTHSGGIILLFLSLPLWAALLLSPCIIYSLVYSLKQHILMHGHSAITGLIWDIKGNWILSTRSGENLDAQLLGSTYLHTRIVILNFIADGSKRTIILLPDALDPDTFRKLRVRMQIEKYKSDDQ